MPGQGIVLPVTAPLEAFWEKQEKKESLLSAVEASLEDILFEAKDEASDFDESEASDVDMTPGHHLAASAFT